MDVKSIAVVGAGTVGRGIAYAALAGGFRTVLTDVKQDILARAQTYIRDTLQKAGRLGRKVGRGVYAYEKEENKRRCSNG